MGVFIMKALLLGIYIQGPLIFGNSHIEVKEELHREVRVRLGIYFGLQLAGFRVLDWRCMGRVPKDHVLHLGFWTWWCSCPTPLQLTKL